MCRMLRHTSFLVVFVLAVLCNLNMAWAEQDNRYIYNQALQDAMLAEEDEICRSLIAIAPGNKNLVWQEGCVLVVTWTRYPESFPPGKEITTRWGDTWVTAVPELKQFVLKNELSEENTLRIEQVLGLPPQSGNMWFAELWVKPDDLFRPSPDPEITDTEACLKFKDSVTEEHKAWFNNTIMFLYFGDKKYPWTRLGYTYDWGNPCSEIGLSEFVIRKGSSITVKSLQSNEAYIKQAREDKAAKTVSMAAACWNAGFLTELFRLHARPET
ncbi:MAG: hypothetical protein ACOY46_04680 [Bacillota bacterium]